MVDETLDMLDFSGLEKFTQTQGFRGLARDIISGEYVISPAAVFQSVINMFFGEITDNLSLLRNLAVLTLLGAVLRNMTDSFKNKASAELGGYALTISVLLLMFASFRAAYDIASSVISRLTLLIEASIPVLTASVILSGNGAGAFILNPSLVFLSGVLALFIKNFILTGIVMTNSVQMVNSLSEKDILTKLTEVCTKAIKFCLKLCVTIFMGVLALERLSVPAVKTLAGKAAKSAVNLVPVVGGALSSSVDTYFYLAKTVKNGVVSAFIISFALILALPAVKLAALSFLYRFAAGIIQPVCDPRIIKCLDAAADFAGLLLSSLLAVSVMFLFVLIIVVTF
ncbi:stage III sporulation protein AE [Clostridia bacterium]|nr:stage III sporulation protein AE [Clostridia bacterium]